MMSDAVPGSRASRLAGAAVWLFVFAVAVRLLVLPLATLDSADSPARVFIGWLWSEQPYYISAGGWGPLHYYLIGVAMKFWPDPVWSPTLLHIGFGALTCVFVYQLALELFRSPRAALLAALGFAVYPLAIATSLEAHPEIPCVALVALGLRFLVRLWRPEGRPRDAVIAGVAITLASALRYEIWMMLPLLAAPLLPQWRKLFTFVAVAMLHPLAWMIGCTLRFGNPLYSLVWSDDYERKLMDHANENVLQLVVQKAVQFGSTAVHGLSLPLAALVAGGVLATLLRRRREALWLLAPAWLFLLLSIAGARGSIWYKPSYTLLCGTMTLPFVAALFEAWRVDAWPLRRYVAACAALLAAVSLTMVQPLWQAVPHGGALRAQGWGAFPEQEQTRSLLQLINDGQPMGRNPLLLDFIGWWPTGYVTSRTRIHPESLCTPNGTPVPVDEPAVQRFLLAHPEGTFLGYDKGRLTERLQMQSADTGVLAGVTLQFTRPRQLPWAGSNTPGADQPGTLTVSQYRVIAEPAVRDTRPAQCTTPCPVSLCSI